MVARLFQVRSVQGTRFIRVEHMSRKMVAVPFGGASASEQSFIDRSAQTGLRDSLTKASRSLRIVLLEASHIGGKLAREVKAAHMNNLQAVIY